MDKKTKRVRRRETNKKIIEAGKKRDRKDRLKRKMKVNWRRREEAEVGKMLRGV